MTRQTALHNWTVPTEGADDYEDTFDTLFADLDRNGELRDVESNLTDYSPKSGAKFRATDTENVFIGDGTTWNQVQSSGKNPNFDSVSTESASVTNETFVRMRRGSDTPTQSAQSWVAIYDTELKDSRDEASPRSFTPDKTAEYEMMLRAEITGTDGDEVRYQVVDSQGDNGGRFATEARRGSIVTTDFREELIAGETYTPQIRNQDSDFVVKGSNFSKGVIRYSVVQA